MAALQTRESKNDHDIIERRKGEKMLRCFQKFAK